VSGARRARTSALVAGLLALATPSSAEPLTWSALVGGFPGDLTLKATRQRVDDLGKAGGIQLWEDLELRYAAKRADLRKQEIDLRVSPSGFGELGANRKVDRSRRSLGEAMVREKTAEAIRDRYKTALDWRFQTRQRRYHLDMMDLCARRIATLAKLTVDPRFDPEDLVKAQVDRADYLAKAEGDLYSIAQIERRMRQFVPAMDSVRLDGELLSPSEIEATLAAVDPALGDAFPGNQVAQRRLDLVDAKTDQEIASSRRWLTYLEVGYTVDVDQNRKERAATRDDISFGGGLLIPVFDGSSQQIARRRADLAQARLEYQDDREDMERDVASLRLSIGSMLRQIVVLDSFAARVDAGGLFADFALKSGGDPLLVIRARETSVENAWKIERLRFEMLGDYLEILHLTGILVDRPGVNHLLSKTPPLAVEASAPPLASR